MTEPIALTSSGALRGTAVDGLCVFRGIRFARAPAAALRFRPPQPPEPWDGVRDATRFGPAAPQSLGMLGPMFSMGIRETSEDCLSLNVWTPGLTGRRPVLVWIHGGAFMLGAGSQALYDGSALARRGDVVVVTINYRLGALGFLRTRELAQGRVAATGNEGLLDQVAALRWVREEIAQFGGDPDRVTIFGESAGAMSCATLLGTPAARGLFHRAILQSGAANFVTRPEGSVRVTRELLGVLHVAERSIERLADLPAESLVEAQGRLFFALRPALRWLRGLLAIVAALRRTLERLARSGRALRIPPFLIWPLTLPIRALELLASTARVWPQGLPLEPVIDGDVLPRPPLESIAAGFARDVPILIGTNLDEVKLFSLLDRGAKALDEAALVARCESVIPGHDESGVSHGRRAVDAYRRARAARGASTAAPELWSAIESDRTMRYPAMRLAELQSERQPQTFAYLLTWRSPFAGGALGACHALELPFVFGTLDHPLLRPFTGRGPDAAALAGRIQDAWIAFARTGDPSHAGIGRWPRYEREQRATMILDRECRVEQAPLEAERRFWETVG